MHPALLIIPLLSASFGWLCVALFMKIIFKPLQPVNFFGVKVQGILPTVKDKWSSHIAEIIQQQLQNSLHQKIKDPAILENIMPEVEKHIDVFLHEKLKTAFPFISMFITEKLLSQLKDLFVTELRSIFPNIMEKLAGNINSNDQVKKEIEEKIKAIDVERAEKLFYEKASSNLNKIKILFALLGLLVGLIQLMIAAAV